MGTRLTRPNTMAQGFSTPVYLFNGDMVDKARHDGTRFLHTCLPVQWGHGWRGPTRWHKVSPHLFTCSMGTWLTRPDTMAQGFSTPVYLFNGDMADETRHDGARLFLPQVHGLHVQRVGIRMFLHCHYLANAEIQTWHVHLVCLHCAGPCLSRLLALPCKWMRKVSSHSLQVDQESVIIFPASGPGKCHHIPCKWTRKVASYSLQVVQESNINHCLQVVQESTITFPASGWGNYHHIPPPPREVSTIPYKWTREVTISYKWTREISTIPYKWTREISTIPYKWTRKISHFLPWNIMWHTWQSLEVLPVCPSDASECPYWIVLQWAKFSSECFWTDYSRLHCTTDTPLPLSWQQQIKTHWWDSLLILINDGLFYVLFLQTGAHSPLQSKEQNTVKTYFYQHTHTHTLNRIAWRGKGKSV